MPVLSILSIIVIEEQNSSPHPPAKYTFLLSQRFQSFLAMFPLWLLDP